MLYTRYTYANIGRTLMFQTRTVHLVSEFGSSTRGERHNSYYANHPQRAAHLVMFKISVCRDPKKPTTSSMTQIQLSPQWQKCNSLPTWSNLKSQLTLFQNPQILRIISSGHDVIHTPAPFPVWGFIMTMVIVISFARKRKLHQLTIHLGS